MDALNAYVLVILLFLALVCVTYSKRSIEHELPHQIVTFYTIYQLLITGLCGITLTGDIFNMYVYKAGLWNIVEFQGLGRKMPYTCFAFTLAAISMIDVSPSAGFIELGILQLIVIRSLDS